MSKCGSEKGRKPLEITGLQSSGPSCFLFAMINADLRRFWIGQRSIICGLSMVLLVLAAYSGSLRGAFVSDDIQEVATKELIRTLDWEHVRDSFRSFDGPNYMPITVESFALDYRLWGSNPTGFHLTNVMLHALNAVLVYALLLTLGVSDTVAFITAAVWALHPLQVESVAWISERKNVLSGVFFFSALLAYLSFSERPRITTYLGVVLLYSLALLSKMNTLVLPAICLGYEIAWRFRMRTRDVLASIPMFAVGAFVAWYNINGNPIHGGEYWGGSAIVTWLSTSVVVFWYLFNLLWPTRLCTAYYVPLHGSVLDTPVLLSVLGLTGMAVFTVYSIAGKRRAGFWLLWFAVTLVPMLNVIPFRSMMNDRYMYLPMLGPLGLITSVVMRLSRAPVLRRATLVLAAGAIVTCAALSYRRVSVWTDAGTLWKDYMRQNYLMGADPISPSPDFDAKVAYLRDVVAREPSSAFARDALGALSLESGHIAEAIAELEPAMRLAPDAPIVAINLGRAYAYAGRLAEARATLERAATLDPYSFPAHVYLANVRLAAGDLDGAQEAYQTCARLNAELFFTAPYWQREREAFKRLQARQEPVTGR